MHLDDSAESVVIGDRQGGVAEIECPAHELGGMRGTVEEAEVGVDVEFCVTMANGSPPPGIDLAHPNRTHVRSECSSEMTRPERPPLVQNGRMYHDEAPDPDQIRRARVRRVVAIIVIVAMIAAVLVPVLVRVVRRPAPPPTVIATHLLA
jgi:hypothetical protein